MHEIEIFILIDEDGDYAIANDRDSLQEAWDSEVGTELASRAMRVIAVKLKVPTPKDVEVSAQVPEQSNEAVVSVS